MPPRYVYWTILIDGKPTAFRAHEKEELLPTFNQLRRTNKDVCFKWFARGRVWESPEAARAEAERPAPREKRPPTWRPGGEHADPRARFKKKGGARSHDTRPHDDRQKSSGDRSKYSDVGQVFGPADKRGGRLGSPRESRPWNGPPLAKGRRGFQPRDSVPKPPAPPDPGVVKREPPKRG